MEFMMGRSPKYEVGGAGMRVAIDPSWRVLDVGSGHQPFVRADVLLERFVDLHTERAGAEIDATDPRLVVGDALAMPFEDCAFDYVVASHVAEHVEDPEMFGRELSRVGKRGYIETPGWFGDWLLREPYHPWRVRRVGSELHFQRITHVNAPGSLAEWIYAVCYVGVKRPGHRSITTTNPFVNVVFAVARYLIAGIFRLPVVVDLIYLRHEWEGEVRCRVTSN